MVEAREWTELFFMFGPIEVMEERVRAPAGLSPLVCLVTLRGALATAGGRVRADQG